jgi:NADH-quinone oxidoreductase subunit D
VHFQVPISEEGDVYARFVIRLEEIKQSAKIIEQLIDRIPAGPIDTFADSKMTKPRKSEVYGSIEGLIQHFELIMTNRGWTPPKAEVYGCTETANGELGYFIVSDGGPRPWRVRTRPPSFIHFSVMPLLSEGHLLADVVAILGSLNIVAAELDR